MYERSYAAGYSRVNTVLPNLCAAAHKCAVRAVEVCRGRMSEIKSFGWEVSMKLSTVIENFDFLNSATAHFYRSIIITNYYMITQS